MAERWRDLGLELQLGSKGQLGHHRRGADFGSILNIVKFAFY